MVVSQDEFRYAIARVMPLKGYKDEAWANARLIAAAPDLLQRLRDLVHCFPRQRHGEFTATPHLENRLIHARLLLHQIEGKEAVS